MRVKRKRNGIEHFGSVAATCLREAAGVEENWQEVSLCITSRCITLHLASDDGR